MNIGILYRKPDESGKDYPFDSEGRGEIKHVLRIKQALQALGYNTHLVELDLDTYAYLRHAHFDLVFNLCDDGFRNDPLLEAHIPAMLDILQIPYSGAGFLSLATCVNKARTKEILAFNKIVTPESQIFENSGQSLKPDMHFPLIVKPIHEDASIGMKKESVVSDLARLKHRIEVINREYNQAALVEKFIQGREIYVGILGNAQNLTVLPLSEIIFDDELEQTAKICTYEAKWIENSEQSKSTPVQCPARIEQSLEQELVRIAKRAYTLLQCSDYGRVDFRIDHDNQPYVLEVNPNPDISEDAGLARMVRACGMTYDDLINRIVTSALEKSRSRRKREKVESI
ncbi:MAG: ATP-grasp domain-containing protein [Candidatus Omnitrophica bacterium]|nr:ATP-grasp domain-containing protein [Candidatus Omnitrophota bacterium]